MKIIIVRHGEPDYSIDSLTEKGWREAELLSKRLCKMEIDDFYCSPLGRARDTAKPTLTKLGREAEILPWMQEFRGRVTSPITGNERICWDLPPYVWGKEDRYFDPKAWTEPELYADSNVKEIWDETCAGVDELLARYGIRHEGHLFYGDSDKTIVIFCHFVLGITIVAHLTGIAPFALWHNFCLAPTSMTCLANETDIRGSSHFRTMYVGDISHLYAGNEEMSLAAFYPECEY